MCWNPIDCSHSFKFFNRKFPWLLKIKHNTVKLLGCYLCCYIPQYSTTRGSGYLWDQRVAIHCSSLDNTMLYLMGSWVHLATSWKDQTIQFVTWYFVLLSPSHFDSLFITTYIVRYVYNIQRPTRHQDTSCCSCLNWFTYPVNRLPCSTFAFWTLRIQAGCCQYMDLQNVMHLRKFPVNRAFSITQHWIKQFLLYEVGSLRKRWVVIIIIRSPVVIHLPLVTHEHVLEYQLWSNTLWQTGSHYWTTWHHSQQDHVMVKPVFVMPHVNVNEYNDNISSDVLHDKVHRPNQDSSYFQNSYSFTVMHKCNFRTPIQKV